jgi:hypothetical protein
VGGSGEIFWGGGNIFLMLMEKISRKILTLNFFLYTNSPTASPIKTTTSTMMTIAISVIFVVAGKEESIFRLKIAY